jgi:hypothetical protein
MDSFISLENKCAAHSELSIFLDYIRGLFEERGGSTPFKKDFNPAKVRSVLPYVALYRIASPVEITLRLIGTEIEKVFGCYKEGANVLSALPEDRHQVVIHFFSEVAKYKCATFQDELLVLGSGMMLDALTVAFPLLDTNGEARYRISVTSLSENSWNLGLIGDFEVTHHTVRNLEFFDLGHGVPEPFM